jgi:hypothetical protein
MNKTKIFVASTLLYIFITGVTLAEIANPEMFVPQNYVNIAPNNDLMFVWSKVKNTKKYRVVISTEGDFSNYDMDNNACIEKNNKCFIYNQLGNTLKISKTKGLTKNEGVSYFWFVQAIGKSESSLVDNAYSFNIEKPEVRYSKVANDGSKLPETAKLGKGLKDWACTKDEKTGLLWEIKTTDGTVRDVNQIYSNYSLGSDVTNDVYKSDTNSFGFAVAVNKNSLCGRANWRLPSADELGSMFVCPSGMEPSASRYDYFCSVGSKYTDTYLVESPIRNTSYFPNSVSGEYWSSSAVEGYKTLGSTVHFSKGYWDSDRRETFYPIRLVSDSD